MTSWIEPDFTTVSRRWVCPPGPVASGAATGGAAVATAAAGGGDLGGRGGVAALGLGLGRLRPLEQVGRDLALGLAGAARRRRRPARVGVAAGGGRLGAGLLGSLAEVLRDLGHRRFASLDHSGPEMPPSLRTRQKWIAMKMTITNGSIRTCSTYQRRSVSVPISAPPRSTKRTWFPKTGV